MRFRTLASCCLLTWLFTSNGLPAEENEPEWTEITVSPARVEEPLFARRLFPMDTARKPGNAAVIILRIAWEKYHGNWDMLDEKAPKLLEMPLDEFAKLDEEDRRVPLLDYEELVRAAYRRDADWQYPHTEERPPEIMFIPEFGQCTSMLRGLAVHCREDILAGRIEESIEKITVGFALSDHLGNVPFCLISYIHADNANLFVDRVEELIRQEGSPNLYWALATLPDPLIDLRGNLDWYRYEGFEAVPEIRALVPERSKREWGEIRSRLARFASFQTGGLAGVRFDKKSPLQVDLDEARRELPKAQPALADRIESMSEDEITVRYFMFRYLTESDRLLRLILLPPHVALPMRERVMKRLLAADERYVAAIPNLWSTYLAAWSVQRRIGALRVIESLRDYSARHDGELPESLDDITEMPVPVDVLTGRPFEYRREGPDAYLSGKKFGSDSHVKLRIAVRSD